MKTKASDVAFVWPLLVKYRVRLMNGRTYYFSLATMVKMLGASGLCFTNSTAPTFGFLK